MVKQVVSKCKIHCIFFFFCSLKNFQLKDIPDFENTHTAIHDTWEPDFIIHYKKKIGVLFKAHLVHIIYLNSVLHLKHTQWLKY